MGRVGGLWGQLGCNSSAARGPSPLAYHPPCLRLTHLARLPAGSLDSRGLLKLLEGLGLQPTQRSVAALMRDLAVPRSGGWGGGGAWRLLPAMLQCPPARRSQPSPTTAQACAQPLPSPVPPWGLPSCPARRPAHQAGLCAVCAERRPLCSRPTSCCGRQRQHPCPPAARRHNVPRVQVWGGRAEAYASA